MQQSSDSGFSEIQSQWLPAFPKSMFTRRPTGFSTVFYKQIALNLPLSKRAAFKIRAGPAPSTNKNTTSRQSGVSIMRSNEIDSSQLSLCETTHRRFLRFSLTHGMRSLSDDRAANTAAEEHGSKVPIDRVPILSLREISSRVIQLRSSVPPSLFSSKRRIAIPL